MNLSGITPLVLTKDEEANIGRTLGQLDWAREVVVVDSFSSDRTVEIARGYQNVRVLQRALDTLAGQSEFGIREATTPWVMLLDADYSVPQAFVNELRALEPAPGVRAYQAGFVYAVNGKMLRGSLYPPRVVLLERSHAKVWQDGHAHRVLVDGSVATLQARIIHDDRKSFRRFLERQKRYMAQEAEKLRKADVRSLPLSGRIRRLIIVAPFAALAHALFVRGLVLDGAAGFRYAFERFVAEGILSVELARRLMRKRE